MPFIENNGVKIHYKVEGNGPALVLIHGGLSSLEDWYDLSYVEQMKADHKLILVDLRGHGMSDHPQKPEAYTYDLFIEDIIGVVDEVGINKFHVAGFSFGGWFVYGLVEKVPDRILSMIVMDGVPEIHDGEILKQMLSNDEMFTGFVSIFPKSIQERLLAADKEKYLLVTDFATREAQSIIDMIKTLVTLVQIPCLVVASEAEEESDEVDLLKFTTDSIPNAVYITKTGLSHPEIFLRSDEVIPDLKEFIAGL